MYKLAEKIIELRLATRRACMCESAGSSNKNTLSLKTKVLYLIYKDCSPKEIIEILCIAKTNLAMLTREMAEEGLIVKSRGTLDRREVNYELTEKGKNYLTDRFTAVEKGLPDPELNEEDYEAAIRLLDKASKLLGLNISGKDE